MSSLRTNFENALKSKLSQKAAGRLTEEVIFLKNFKHFDLEGTGLIDLPTFIKSCEKTGVHTFTSKQLEELFKFYDQDADGKINYKEMAGIIFGNTSSTTRQMSPQRGTRYIEDLNEIERFMEKIRFITSKRGQRGIIELGLQIKNADKDHDRKLERDEFFNGIRDYGCDLTQDQSNKLFDYFDKDKKGRVDLDEFIFIVKGKLNPFRLALVNQVFDKINNEYSSGLTLNDLKGLYNAKNHPDVKNNKRKEDDILNEFIHILRCVYDYHELDNDKVTRPEFLELFSFISATIDNDQYFEIMMNNVWKNKDEENNKRWNDKGWPNQEVTPNRAPSSKSEMIIKNGTNSIPQSEREKRLSVQRSIQQDLQDTMSQFSNRSQAATSNKTNSIYTANTNNNSQSNIVLDLAFIIKNIRAKLAARGAKGFIGLQRQFKIMDDNGDNAISFNEFAKAMRDYKISLSEAELRTVYNTFDENRSGIVKIEKFIKELRGEMNDFRRNLVQKAFEILDTDNDGLVKINDIKGIYSARMHPDVKAGKKTEDEILGEFLESFEAHHLLHAKNLKDQIVSLKEFLEYYNHVSASIDDDKYFEIMIYNGYKIYNKESKNKENPSGNIGTWQEESKLNRQPYALAPFGTSPNANDWSTSNRPKTVQAERATPRSSGMKETPAGFPSWPGANLGAPQYASPQINNKAKNESERLFSTVRDKFISRGIRGVLSLERLFKIMDETNSRVINPYCFQKVLKDLRIDLDENGLKTLFQTFDHENKGLIDYDEFLKAIRGTMNENRKKYVTFAFQKLDKNGNGQVNIDEIRSIYNAKMHPDVRSKKRTEEDILVEFLDTFEMHHILYTGEHSIKNMTVNYDEFLQYYNNISCCMSDDRLWELMIVNTWNLNDNYSLNKQRRPF